MESKSTHESKMRQEREVKKRYEKTETNVKMMDINSIKSIIIVSVND